MNGDDKYMLISLVVVLCFAFSLFFISFKSMEKIECYKVAQVNNNIKCE